MCPGDSVDSRGFPWLAEIIDIFGDVPVVQPYQI